MDRRTSRNDYVTTDDDSNEISLMPAGEVSPTTDTESGQAADIPLPSFNMESKKFSTAGPTKPSTSPTIDRGDRRSTIISPQNFIPLSMRALFYSVEPATDSSMEPIPDGPASPKPRRVSNPGTRLVLDPNFPSPQPSPQEYLLKVQTAAFCHDEMRLSTALNPQKTTPQIPLHSICGTVVSTPSQDDERPEGPMFQIGDTVWGVTSYVRDGGAADYALATEAELALKPANIGAQEAAALALPGLTAWQALFRHAEIDPNVRRNGNGNGDVDGKGKEVQGISKMDDHKGDTDAPKSSIFPGGNGANGNSNSGNDQGMFKTNIFNGHSNGYTNGHTNGQSNGNGEKKSIHGREYSNGRGNGYSWLRKSMENINSLARSASVMTLGNGNSNGNGHRNGNGNGKEKRKSSGNGHLYGFGRRRSTWLQANGGPRRRRRGSQEQLRILITNARDSEVGRIAVQLLRAEMIFPSSERPWICVTCATTEEEIVRGSWDVDEVIIIPRIPEAEDCEFEKIFRAQRWPPVDVVLDCAGGIVFRQVHSPAVVKDGGAVLTAVDPWPAQETSNSDPQDTLGRRKRGLKTMFVPVNPDGASLARIVDLVERNMVRGRPEQVTDLVQADRLLRDHAVAAGAARRGAMMVVRVN
ncbi:hypothetical protein N7539_007238 [Penicillium diatomitis]|uniref:Alcohol dehydrogenase-like N-terminal domain-containing protein n=1 Tax=Penicillium diatomitis TaxID=2819901 RepID=A0A9X0BNN3_9EURO|nr:uncharacterized protein N7539_007238 [Penicillium diatomitis]KAJ5477094.1 hypothetical protein N7539_007238 [Penicillium diatomitis]